MTTENQVADVWAGRFGSAERLNAYLAEFSSRTNQDAPLSQFAIDQNQTFYNRDFVKGSFHQETDDFVQLCQGRPFMESQATVANEAFRASGLRRANVLLFAFGNVIDDPWSVNESTYQLAYLGRFHFAPNITAVTPGEAGQVLRQDFGDGFG